MHAAAKRRRILTEAGSAGTPIAIIAGGGALPNMVRDAALRSGRRPVLIAIAGEADADTLSEEGGTLLHWGQIGRLFRILRQERCQEAILIGWVRQRPNYWRVWSDFGTVRLLPKLLWHMRKGDDHLLSVLARLLAKRGVHVMGPLEIAPELAMPEGRLTPREPDATARRDIEIAAAAARNIGRLDVGQGAVAVGGMVVATEGAEGTDALLKQVRELRRAGSLRSAGGVLVKCMKPQQDSRLDVPTLGPETARYAKEAGLDGVAAEAGRTLMAGREETIAAFASAGLFLFGMPNPGSVHGR
jgi:UDP-2,3-diacylglucosamine hydrolase